MTQSIQNIDSQNNANMPVRRVSAPARRIPPQAVRIPEYYEDNNKQSLKERLEKNPLYSVFNGFFGPFIEHPFASVLTWFGCSFLLDKYTDACSGNYETSLLKRAANFGDNLQNSKFVQSKPMQKILGFFKSGSNRWTKVVDNNSVLKAMRDTPTMPELDIVKSEMIPQRQRVVHDFNYIVSELKLAEVEDFAHVNSLAVSKKEKESAKKFFNKILNVSQLKEVPEERISSYIQLKRLGFSEDFIKKAILLPDGGVFITKQEILKAMGNKDIDWIKAVREDTIGKYVEEVQEATRKVGGKVKIGLCKVSPFGIDLGPLTLPGERILSCDNVYNRLHSLELGKGVKTKTGLFMSKMIQLIHRGLTFGGGKYGVLIFIAPALVETAINVHKAEGGQKLSTGVNNLVNHISWVFTFPIALQIMHHVCGAKYAGMTKEQVQQVRAIQNEINEKNKLNGTPDGYKSYKEWDTARTKAKAKIRKIETVENQKWYTKAIRKVAGWITPDLGKFDAYNPGNLVGKKVSQMRNLPRNLWGVPVRLLLFGLLTMGVLDAAINKCIKAIFGDSYDSMKEEEQKDAKKEQKAFLKEDLNNRLYEMQRKKVMAAAKANRRKAPVQNPQTVSHRGKPQVPAGAAQLRQYQKETQDNYTYIPSQENVIESKIGKGKLDTYSYIPSQDSTVKTDKNGNSASTNIRTYIPSQAAANITKSWDNSHLKAALDRAQRAENRALKVLSGNFEGM